MLPTNTDHFMRNICVALTGASGTCYGLRLIECLIQSECHITVLISATGCQTLVHEQGWTLPSQPHEARRVLCEHYKVAPERISFYGQKEWFSPPASGSNAPHAMVVCPCSMGTLAAIAHGLSDNLLERAADVMLKERRPLVLVPRETPLSLIHLKNMVSVTEAGGCILPANPGFYQNPRTTSDLVDFVVARILDVLNIPHTLVPRWCETE